MVLLYPIIVLQQSMNDSFASAQDYQHKISNNLFNQIQTENTNHWKNDQFSFSFDRSQNEDMNGSRRSVSFDNDLAIQSKIIEPIIQAQQILEMPQEQEQENKQVQLEPLEIKNQEPPSSLSSTSNQPCQVTIIIHQESLASKLYEEIDTQDSSSFSISLKSFLSLNDKNYKPHVKCLKFLYNSLKEYSKKSLQNLKNYIYFNEVKLKQEIESLRFLDSLQAASREEKDTENLNMDEKVILLQIRNQNISRREKRKVFYKAIQGYYQKLLQSWRKIKQRREKRERYIEQEIIRVIDRIQLEMEDMIICRLQNQKEHLQNFYISRKIRSPNPFLIKDKYLEMKYLMQRENAYLKLMHDFNGKVITYMVSMFSKEESQIAKTIKEVLIDYAISYMECYDSSNQILNMKIDNLEQSKCEEHVKIQLCENLLNMIPIQLYNIAERNQKIKYSPSEKLEALLTDFSNSLQNTIFLSTIEMNNDFIMFRNQALWKTNSSILHKEQSSILYESKAQSKFETKQVLTNSRHSYSQTHLQKNMKVIVVLTSNYHLHLQYEDKVATLRLGDIKLSKRGREVIITSKEKGLGGYLGLKKELGVLQFQSVSEVELFAQKLSRALSRIAYYS